ncbi:MAG TPA: BamA/TamA family outer membrane protein, partial [Gemmatimonadaceae bacterium]|nr:BamA/TamA family outer membrane protein [Gemmatimonadaceae bacterium]
ARYRDDQTDRSNEFGLETSVIRELGRYRFLTLRHRYSSRHVLDYRLGSGSTIDLRTLLALAANGSLSGLNRNIERSTVSISTSLGHTDPTHIARGLQLLPSYEITTPPTHNTIEFSHAELPFSAYVPLAKRVAFAMNARIGRVSPFGKTVAGGGTTVDPLVAVQMRDVLLTAGGTGSVRGWGNGLLGPKQLNLQFKTLAGGDSVQITGTDGYIPAGGLARTTAQFELRLPFPGLSEMWGTHVFVDAGRVWTTDPQFKRANVNNEERWFYSTGAGIDINTIVGPIRVSLGYKMNPSPLDVRSASDVLKAISAGLPATSAPVRSALRRQIHISLGQRF